MITKQKGYGFLLGFAFVLLILSVIYNQSQMAINFALYVMIMISWIQIADLELLINTKKGKR